MDHARAQDLLDRYNRSGQAEHEERDRLLRSLLGSVGEGVIVKPSFRCDYGTRIDPGPRRAGWESAQPITIGDNVWLGAGVFVCPGVTIGNDTVVGAGAVVTRDLPAGVVAFGVPAKPSRRIGDQDRIEVPDR